MAEENATYQGKLLVDMTKAELIAALIVMGDAYRNILNDR